MEWTDWGDALERTSQNLTPEERQIIASLPYSPVSADTTIWLRPAAYYAAEKTLLAVSDELTQHQWEVAPLAVILLAGDLLLLEQLRPPHPNHLHKHEQ